LRQPPHQLQPVAQPAEAVPLDQGFRQPGRHQQVLTGPRQDFLRELLDAGPIGWLKLFRPPRIVRCERLWVDFFTFIIQLPADGERQRFPCRVSPCNGGQQHLDIQDRG
jgi:hypothetical protein